MTESPTSTATALLDAAEVALADHDLDDVSLRSIMRAAKANPAAVHYHYGSRDALAKAVLERVLGPINARRMVLLDELEGRGVATVRIEEVVEALVRPDLEAVRAVEARNPGGARLIGAIYRQPTRFVKALVEEQFGPVAARFAPVMAIALPDVSATDIAWRVRWCVFGMLGALLSDDQLDLGGHRFEQMLANIVVAASGALGATTRGGKP